jgi:hypothetical protein
VWVSGFDHQVDQVRVSLPTRKSKAAGQAFAPRRPNRRLCDGHHEARNRCAQKAITADVMSAVIRILRHCEERADLGLPEIGNY